MNTVEMAMTAKTMKAISAIPATVDHMDRRLVARRVLVHPRAD